MQKVKKQQKVLVGLSGGVDSAVSAYLLQKAGYEVEGVFMKNWSSTTGLKYSDCPWLSDRRDALRVAAHLNIPLHTVDFEKEYEAKVLKYFFNEYKAGRTPNPDVMCNKEIKFKLLYNWAMTNGFDFLATGHYARSVATQSGSVTQSGSATRTQKTVWKLLKSKDVKKDQTYFIYNLDGKQLSHLLFPVGGFNKTQIKAIAKKAGLPNADRKESMGLCFVGKIRLNDFLAQKVKPSPGKIVDTSGKVLGKHNGLHTFTIGQRQGIKIASSTAYYVAKKDIKNNVLVVTQNPNDPLLYTKQVELNSLHLINSLPKQARVLARFRHQGQLVKAELELKFNQTALVTFKEQQKALASGQSIVLYQKNVCLGGGVIK